jgi:glycosyltransferase involved in cell wall biosynthesis
MCFALRHADRVLANSDFTRDTLISLIGVPPGRISVIYPTIDIDRMWPGQPHEDLLDSLGLDKTQPLILSVGRLVRRKGFDQVIKSLPYLKQQGLDAHYALIGIGEDWDYLKELAGELGVSDRVHLLGHVKADDLPRWYSACALFAMPNRDIQGDTEGFGLVYLEAGACEKPVLAGTAGGTGSAVVDGVTGLRVDGENLEAVQQALALLLSDTGLAEQMGRSARERARANFAHERRVGELRALVEADHAPPRVTGKTARILMYTAYFDPEYSGAALQALTLARELRQRGHHVEFITNRWPGLDETGEVEGFAVRRVEPGRWRKHREFRLWLSLSRCVWRRRHHFDILHSHGAYYTHAFIGPLSRMAGLKSLVKASLANDDLLDLNLPIIGNIHRQMLCRIDAYVAISADLAGEFKAGGLDPEKIQRIPNGVDTDLFHPCQPHERMALRANLNLPVQKPIVLYVGVLDRRKNIEWLADQWVRHRAFDSNGLLVAVGPQSREDAGGVLRGQLVALSQSHPDLFLLRDFSCDIRLFYQCADLLILPSLREGLPNVVLEAMASGLPCVAARASGTRELILEGETGYTYAHGNTEEMGEAIRRCLSPDGARMGENAREMALTHFSIRAIADQYEALYEKLLSQSR